MRHFWSGHKQTHVSERYIKLLKKRDWRLQWAEGIGLGFELPGAKLGRLGRLIEFRKVGEFVSNEGVIGGPERKEFERQLNFLLRLF